MAPDESTALCEQLVEVPASLDVAVVPELLCWNARRSELAVNCLLLTRNDDTSLEVALLVAVCAAARAGPIPVPEVP